MTRNRVRGTKFVLLKVAAEHLNTRGCRLAHGVLLGKRLFLVEEAASGRRGLRLRDAL